MGLAHHAQGQSLQGISLVAFLVRVRGECERRFVRHRDAAGSVGEVQHPVRRDRPDYTRGEVVFSIRPDLLAVEEDFVLVSLSWLQLCDPYQGVVMALDLESAGPVAENLDLAGGVGLHPDGRVALACIAEEGADDEAGGGSDAGPTGRAITG